jgi:Holliday junction resolvase
VTGGIAPRRKGSAFECQVVSYLRGAGFPQAAKTLAGASADRGDIQGVPGVVLECKAHKALDLAGWLTEARQEAENAALTRFAVIAKRRGIADVAESYAILPLWLLAELLREDQSIRGGTR